MAELPSSLVEKYPWNPEKEAIWVATSLVLKRNLAHHNFPGKLNSQELDQVRGKLNRAMESLDSLKGKQIFSQGEMSSASRQLIYEHFFFLRGFTDAPDGAGMLIEEEGNLLGTINSGNHFELRTLTLGAGLDEGWNRLSQIEEQIGKSEDYAFLPKFGYLTADPAQCGTGLIVQAYLHLPALIHMGQLESAIANSEEDDVEFLGLSGDLMELTGDLIVVRNAYTIGVSEEAIQRCVERAATKLLGAEKTLRSHIKEEGNLEIKDLISKAFGLLVHSFQLDTREAIDLLSTMKLGLALGYIENVTEETLNRLFFQCRRGHLMHLFQELVDPEAIEKKRADYLQEQLSGIRLSPELSS